MGEDFLKEYSEVAKQVKADPASVICGSLSGMSWTAVCSLCCSISKAVPLQAITTERATAPTILPTLTTMPSTFSARERYHSNEFQQEAYLFIPFDEDYYQAMASDRGTL